MTSGGGEIADDLGPHLSRAFFARTAAEVARDLIGATLLVEGVGGLIVETEAYDQSDPASHSFVGKTARNASMFGPPGHAYVYRSYGIHWCLNAVCGSESWASGVLLRAIQPRFGLSLMQTRRGVEEPRQLCSGPGRLCQALAVTRALDGQPLDQPPFELRGRMHPVEITTGPRVGISRAVDVPWRFGLAGSSYLSKPFRKA
jgi:DNA-3-methyladenine glycosylase